MNRNPGWTDDSISPRSTPYERPTKQMLDRGRIRRRLEAAMEPIGIEDDPLVTQRHWAILDASGEPLGTIEAPDSDLALEYWALKRHCPGAAFFTLRAEPIGD